MNKPKEMTNHDYARYLLSLDEKPLLIGINTEREGDWHTNYYHLEGVQDNLVEDCFVVQSCNEIAKDINSKFYAVGDGFAYYKGKPIALDSSFLEYAILDKGDIYTRGVDEDLANVGFFEDPDKEYYERNPEYNSNYKKLDNKLKVALTSGFHPIFVEYDIAQASLFYKLHRENDENSTDD